MWEQVAESSVTISSGAIGCLPPKLASSAQPLPALYGGEVETLRGSEVRGEAIRPPAVGQTGRSEPLQRKGKFCFSAQSLSLPVHQESWLRAGLLKGSHWGRAFRWLHGDLPVSQPLVTPVTSPDVLDPQGSTTWLTAFGQTVWIWVPTLPVLFCFFYRDFSLCTITQLFLCLMTPPNYSRIFQKC